MATRFTQTFILLNEEVCTLHERVQFLKDVFGTQDQIDTLNECAPAAFYFIQRSFYDLAFLEIARLVDEDNDSLTLNTLLTEWADNPLESRLKQILVLLKDLIVPMKRHRNKRIAHKDAKVARRGSLPGIDSKQIEEALGLIRDFMNAVSSATDGSITAYESILSVGDGKSLFHVVKDGVVLDELRVAAWKLPPEEIVTRLRYRD